jgi:hypothetical protein
MKTIYKAILDRPMNAYGEVVVTFPKDARLLSAILQNNEIVIYAAVESDNESVEYPVLVVGTGKPLPADAMTFLGSVAQGPFVWHVFTR